jgi:hypothetical protein
VQEAGEPPFGVADRLLADPTRSKDGCDPWDDEELNMYNSFVWDPLVMLRLECVFLGESYHTCNWIAPTNPNLKGLSHHFEFWLKVVRLERAKLSDESLKAFLYIFP